MLMIEQFIAWFSHVLRIDMPSRRRGKHAAKFHASPPRTRRKQRIYTYVPYRHERRRRMLTVGALCFLLVFNVYKLGAYVLEYTASKQASEDLRQAYYAVEADITATAVITSTPVPVTPQPTQTPTPVPDATSPPTATPQVMLDPLRYPNNPYALVSSRFQKLQQQNSDIIGWLSIPNLLDEGVVQRDNSYYLRRDYRGYHNNNGAIFLEETCDLSTRPYTMMLFGHNMKTGAMFGCLRNYENLYFYSKNAFIDFNTAYEDGRYIIFAIGTLSQNERDYHYLDIGMLNSLNIQWRESAIAQLKRISEITTGISVDADDQLLLLITCVDDDSERRVVAARRVRDGESKESLQRLANYARKN